VKAIVTYDGDLEAAKSGQAVTLTLEDEIDVSRGDMLAHKGKEPLMATTLRASIVWMAEHPLIPGKLYNFKVGTQSVPGKVHHFEHRVDVNTLEKSDIDQLELNGIAECVIQFDAPVAFDSYVESRFTGAIIVIDRLTNVTVGAAMAEEAVADLDANTVVTAEDRAARLGQKPAVISLSKNAFSQVELIERVLLNKGIVAIVKKNATESDVALLRNTGLTVIIENEALADSHVTEERLDDIVFSVIETVRL
jgi:sulfate adenylyltransferase subunit 1